MKIGISLPVRELQNDLSKIKAFAQKAEEIGLTHLRVPDQIVRPGSAPLHESFTMMAFIAGITSKIELVPSVISLPARPTAVVAKQSASLDHLSLGRLRLGVGVGKEPLEFEALGIDFNTRGSRCEEQIPLLRRLWTEKTVSFKGRWNHFSEVGINPLPIQQPIPIWIGASAIPMQHIRRRIGRLADGWFVLCSPENFTNVRDDIDKAAENCGRDPSSLGTEAGVSVVGSREHEWQSRVDRWREIGLSHLCLRTLGGSLEPQQHIEKMCEVVDKLKS